MNNSPNRFETLPPLGKALVVVSITVLAVIILFAIAEGAIRLRQFVRYGAVGAGIEKLYHYDDAVGLRVPIAGYQSERISIDSRGFRNPEFITPKPPGTIRLAFLGGSTTFSAEVSRDEATWPYLVVEHLRAGYPKKSFDYINAGIPGYTTRQSLKNLALRVATHDPDIIVIYHAWNDLKANSRKAARERRLQFSTEAERLSWLSDYSLLIYLLEKNLFIWNRQRAAGDKNNKLDVPGEVLSNPFRQDLETLVLKAREVADRVVLVTFSIKLRAEQSPEKRIEAAATGLYYLPFMTPEYLIRYFGAYNQVIRKIGEDTESLVVGTENAIPGTAVHFNDTVHLSDAGSALMAKRVARALIDAQIVERLAEAKH